MVYTRSPDYLYRRNGIYYFTRNVPSDLKARFNKSRVVVSLHTRSIVKAQKSALALCDRLDRYFESLRLERFHSQELGLKFSCANDALPNEAHSSISDALDIVKVHKCTANLNFSLTKMNLAFDFLVFDHNLDLRI